MTRSTRTILAPLVAAVALTGCALSSALAQNVMLRNGVIHTMASENPAQALAFDGEGKIIAVGTEDAVRAAAGDNPRIVDLAGNTVLPGFQDAHMHLIEAGVNKIRCGVGKFDPLNNIRDAIKDCASNSTADWILGSGVSMPHLLRLTNDPVGELDDIERNRPVLILDDIGHGAWANSMALKLAGYDSIAGNPPGGIILRNQQTGRPNGIVLENAQQKLRNLASPDTPANVDFAYQSMKATLETMAKNGITTVSDAGGFWPQGHLKAWQRAEANKTLTVRALNALYVYPDLPFDEQMEKLSGLYSNSADPGSLLKFNQAKIYVDGILEQRTGAVLESYRKDRKGKGINHGFERGFLYFEGDSLNRYSKALSEKGFKLHFHVTGDRGARLALDAIEQADKKPGPHRLTHIYLLDKTDYPRFSKTGTVADFQLAPSSLSSEYRESIREFIGDRVGDLMPAESLEKDGALVVMSSDYDADELSPLVKIQAALQRSREGAPDVRTAVKWMTINPARLLNQDNTTGTLAPGKFADLVVLDRNIFTVPVAQISSITVRATLLQGKPVYDKDGLFQKN